MKKVMIALALFIGLNAAQAQNRGDFNKDPEARAKAKVDRLEKELNLSASQKESIHTLVLDQAKNQQNIFKESGQKRDKIREQMKEMSTQTDRKIEAVLDDSQKQKFAELQKEWTKRRSEGGQREGRNRAQHN